MKKSRIIVSAIAFSLLSAGIVSAQTKLKIEKKSPSSNEAIIEIHKDGKERVFVVEGSQSEIQSKLDSIFESHGIDRSHKVHHQKNMTTFQWTGDSTAFDFDFSFDDIDPQVYAFVQQDIPIHMEMFGMNDSIIKHHEVIVREEVKRLQDEMEHMQITMDDSVMFIPQMHQKRMMYAPMADDNVIVIKGEEDDPHQAIILKKDEAFENGQEIEVKTKKKKNETVITIRKK